jgi:hypothetical protein
LVPGREADADRGAAGGGAGDDGGVGVAVADDAAGGAEPDRLALGFLVEGVVEEDAVVVVPIVGGDAVEGDGDHGAAGALGDFDQAVAGVVVVAGLAADEAVVATEQLVGVGEDAAVAELVALGADGGNEARVAEGVHGEDGEVVGGGVVTGDPPTVGVDEVGLSQAHIAARALARATKRVTACSPLSPGWAPMVRARARAASLPEGSIMP